MKKMRRSIAVALVLVFSFSLLTACGGPKYEGTWKLAGGKMAGVELTGEAIEEKMGNLTMTLNSDGTASISIPGSSGNEAGKWKEESDGVTISDADGSNPVKFTLDGDTLKGSVSGIELIFKKA